MVSIHENERDGDMEHLTIEERDSLMEDLGMRKTKGMVLVDLHQHFAAGLGRFRGQVITGNRPIWIGLFGILYAGSPPPDEISWTLDPDGETPSWAQIWRFTAWKAGSPILAELRCPPRSDFSIHVHGMEKPHKDEDLLDVLRSIRLYARTLPKGPGRPSRDSDLAIQCAIWHDDEGLTHKQIAKRLGWHLSVDDHNTPRRSAAVKGHIDLGRRLRGQKNSLN